MNTNRSAIQLVSIILLSLVSIVLLSFFPQDTFAQGSPTSTTRYNVVPFNGGHGSSMTPVSVNLLLASRASEQIANKVSGWARFSKPDDSYNFGRLFGRITWLMAVDLPLATWLTTIQHEYAGHRARTLEFGGNVLRLDIGHPWKFEGSVLTDLDGLNGHERCIVAGAGLESESQMADEMLKKMLSQSRSRHSDLTLFMMSRLSMPMYVRATPYPGTPEWEAGKGNDVIGYLMELGKYSNRSLEDLHKEARRGAVWSMLDPGLLAGSYAYLVGYIGRGKREVELPMLRLGDVSILPGTKFHLSPLGPEYYLHLYLKTDRSLLSIYGRSSRSHEKGPSYGFGIERSNVTSIRALTLDVAFDFWRQPIDITQDPTIPTGNDSGLLGANAEIRANLMSKSRSKYTPGAFVKLGYKSKGFLMGRPLESGFHGHIGLSLDL
jgi:predicted nucleic acid-binding Zn ribbon protein